MAFTYEQEKAIFTNGRNIIVSAGAGSGKTSVLTQRIFEKVKQGISIDSLLVLTFTNAAAYEMKERVKKKIKESGLFKEELDKIDTAQITTFDAFCLSTVKKYYYKLNISPKINILSSIVMNFEKRKIINQIFMELYKNEDERFFQFLDKFSQKDDKDLVDLIIDITNKIMLKSDTLKFLDNYMNSYFDFNYLNSLINEYENIVIENKEDLMDSLYDYKLILESDDLNYESVSSIDEILNELNYTNSYDSLRNFIINLKLPSLKKNSGEDLSKAKKELTDIIKKFNENYLGQFESKVSMLNNLIESKDDVSYLIYLCRRTINEVLEFKKEKNCYEYIDITKMAISLVKDYSDVNLEFRSKYREILVDEYQDTSDLQEEFISAFANNNVYMVGDMKQAIYRFRNANPYIFKEKYDLFHHNNDLGYAIELNKNFRSRNEVVNDINFIFNSLMSEKFGDANYKKNHTMIFGNLNYEENVNPNTNYNMEVLRYRKENKEYENAEVEAFIIAKDIKNKISNYKILEKNKLRNATYSDFCILVDKSRDFITIKKILESENIPLSIIGDLDLKESFLPLILCNILTIISEVKDKASTSFKHAYTSIARSFIYNKTDEEIYKSINTWYKDDSICDIAYELSKDIDFLSNSDLYLKALNSFNIYENLEMISNVKESLIQIEYFCTMIDELSNLGYTFSETASYIREILTTDEAIKYSVDSKDLNQVKIMTIHKSKGLEFPICYYALLSSQFNKEETKKVIGFDNKYGIYLPTLEDNKVSNTLLKCCIKEQTIKDDISERIRLFYVALTRAKEHIIIISEEVEYKKRYNNPKNFSCFNHFINSIPNISSYYKKMSLKDLNMSKDYKINKDIQIEIDSLNEEITYHENPFVKVEITKGSISKEMINILSIKEKENIDLGLSLHSIFENIDFYNPDFEVINDRFQKEIVKNVLNNEIFKNIKNGKIFKEHEFYMDIEDTTYHGIIDLMIVYDTHVDIIDYKLSNLDKAEYQRQLGVYMNYVKTKFDKEINTYLLSLVKNEIKKVEV